MRELSEELNEMLSLEKPKYTESELEERHETWNSVFNSKAVVLSDIGDILIRTVNVITKWENSK